MYKFQRVPDNYKDLGILRLTEVGILQTMQIAVALPEPP